MSEFEYLADQLKGRSHLLAIADDDGFDLSYDLTEEQAVALVFQIMDDFKISYTPLPTCN